MEIIGANISGMLKWCMLFAATALIFLAGGWLFCLVKYIIQKYRERKHYQVTERIATVECLGMLQTGLLLDQQLLAKPGDIRLITGYLDIACESCSILSKRKDAWHQHSCDHRRMSMRGNEVSKYFYDKWLVLYGEELKGNK